METIQSSLNQLSLSLIGAVGGISHGVKGTFIKPQAPKTEPQTQPQAQPQTQPRAETQSGMGNIVKIGRNYGRTNIRSYEAASRAVYSGNEAIMSKATSHFDPITARLEEINKAVKSFVETEKEDKK